MLGKLRLELWIGIVLLFVPFFGIPDWLRTTLTIAIGLLLIYMVFTLRRSYKKLKFELRQGAIVPDTTQSSPIIHG